MRKLVIAALLVLAAGAAAFKSFNQTSEETGNQPQVTTKEVQYRIDARDPISQQEAETNPPQERWPVIKQLTETIAIDVICHPSSSQIVDNSTVKEIADSLQHPKYVETTAYPTREPDAKLYFRKNDGFIMAGRFYAAEGIILSPEGPVIKIDPAAAKKIIENTNCNK